VASTQVASSGSAEPGSDQGARSDQGTRTPRPPPNNSQLATGGVTQPESAQGTPPAAFAPPFAETQAAGDGEWRPLGDAALGELAALQPYALFRSTVHPHPRNSFVRMDVVAIDLNQLRLGWVIGSKDEGAGRLASLQTPGLVPAGHQSQTLAVFNGGFQARHGWWGMQSDGITIVPPKSHGCTIALFQDSHVSLAPWHELNGRSSDIKVARQAPPCLLHNDEIHPDLLLGKVKIWAGQNTDLKTRRRSAAGLSSDGKILFFAIGTETQAIDLARGLLAVGAGSAIQLDINWAWARLLVVGRRDDKPRPTSSLLPQALYGKNEFFSRPSERDFFYVWRPPAP
jgi:hypothetical protein